MDVWVSVEGSDPVEGLADLENWLRQEPEFRGMVAPVGAEPQPGELGALVNALSIAIGSGGTLSVLAASLKAYFAQPRRSDIRITIRAQDGHSVEIDAKRVKDVESLVLHAFGQDQ